MIGSDARSMSSTSIICGTHSVSILMRRLRNWRASGPCMIRGPGWASGESGPSGGGGISALMYWWPKPVLVAETGNPIAGHVAADHPIGQAHLIRLIDDAPAPAEII